MDTLIIFLAKYLVFIEVLGFLYLGYRAKEPNRFIQLTVITSFIALCLFTLGRLTYDNPRPFVVTGVPPLVAHAPDNGFPSGHSLAAGIMAVVIASVQPALGVVFWIAALLVGAGRVFAGVHHVIDVLASFLIVLLSGYLARRVPKLLDVRRFKAKG